MTIAMMRIVSRTMMTTRVARSLARSLDYADAQMKKKMDVSSAESWSLSNAIFQKALSTPPHQLVSRHKKRINHRISN